MKRYPLLLLFACLPVALFAQGKNLNPTVQVTNAYQARIVESEKPAAIITIPDSLYKFNLDFDYSGFENPYRGSSDFNPFLTELDLAKRPVLYKNLYFKAGAGYAFSPELELAWEIKSKGNFKIGAFASHDSYFGKYCGYLDRGSDARTRAGLDFRFDWKKANMVLSTWYDGVMGKNNALDSLRHYHSLCASLALNSNLDPSESAFRYRLLANYYYGSDKCGGSSIAEHVVDADGFVDLVFGKHIIEIDADFDMDRSDSYSGIAVVGRPRYLFNTGALSLAAGLAVGWCHTGGTATRDKPMNFFPSVDLKVNAVPQKLVFYAAADMESKMFSRRDAALMTRFFVPDLHKAIEKTEYALLGFKGDLSGKFSYDASFGYRRETNKSLYDMTPEGLGFAAVPSLKHYFASLKLKAVAGPVAFGGSVEYRQYNDRDSLAILPPAFRADAFFRLRVHDRWRFAVTADYVSFYRSNGLYADDFVNLTAELRYNFTSRFGVYVKGSNLLGQKLQIVPGYGRSGVCVLGGIVLTL